MSPPIADLRKHHFGRLTVIKMSARRDKQRRIYWICKCACGATSEVRGKSLIDGSTRSCGCLRRETSITTTFKHGMTNTPTWNSWRAMMKRCYYEREIGYPRYGGRGIRVCKRWHKFENFLEDMGQRPRGKTLDRWPNQDGDYKPDNCRWATAHQQAKNRKIRERDFSGRFLAA